MDLDDDDDDDGEGRLEVTLYEGFGGASRACQGSGTSVLFGQLMLPPFLTKPNSGLCYIKKGANIQSLQLRRCNNKSPMIAVLCSCVITTAAR